MHPPHWNLFEAQCVHNYPCSFLFIDDVECWVSNIYSFGYRTIHNSQTDENKKVKLSPRKSEKKMISLCLSDMNENFIFYETGKIKDICCGFHLRFSVFIFCSSPCSEFINSCNQLINEVINLWMKLYMRNEEPLWWYVK